jgi:UDP-glucose 4-epimerase
MSNRDVRHIAVVGGMGYLGLHLIQFFQQKYQISIIDQYLPNRVAYENFLHQVNETLKTYYVNAQDLDPLSFKLPIDEIDTLIYAASVADVKQTKAWLDWAESQHVKQVIFFSSAAIYGAQSSPVSEESMSLQVLSPYGQLKQQEESYLKVLGSRGDMQVSCLRLFNVYGSSLISLLPSGTSFSLIDHLMKLAQSAKSPLIRVSKHPTDDQSFERDYIHVSDVMFLCEELMNRQHQLNTFEVFNVGTGSSTSLHALIDEVESLTNSQFCRMLEPAPDFEVATAVAQVERVSKALGWQPRTGLQSGLATHFMKYYE